MNCPHCEHSVSSVIDTRERGNAYKRTRICRGCGKTFTTIERIAVYAGNALGFIEATDEEPADPEPPSPGGKRKPPMFVASLDDPELVTLPAEIQSLLIEWWNVSRRSKHGAAATWTETAWQLSVRRVAKLSPAKQRQLAEAGVEHGWQALKPEYAKASAAEPTGLAPRASAMQEAIEQWHAS